MHTEQGPNKPAGKSISKQIIFISKLILVRTDSCTTIDSQFAHKLFHPFSTAVSSANLLEFQDDCSITIENYRFWCSCSVVLRLDVGILVLASKFDKSLVFPYLFETLCEETTWTSERPPENLSLKTAKASEGVMGRQHSWFWLHCLHFIRKGKIFDQNPPTNQPLKKTKA